MNYNIHPIFVHVPIAMLAVYSIIKIIPFKNWFPHVEWRQIERTLLFVGLLGAGAAFLTGDSAEQLLHPNRQLVDMHSTFGGAAIYLYGALLLGEITALINAHHVHYVDNKNFLRLTMHYLENILCNRAVSTLIAFIALIVITITGLLGGVIAYGVTADPIAPYLLKLLRITL